MSYSVYTEDGEISTDLSPNLLNVLKSEIMTGFGGKRGEEYSRRKAQL